MVKVRLARYGAKKRPFYRIVAVDPRSRRDGKFLEIVGYYDPLHEPAIVQVKMDRVDYWKSVGAQLTDTVASILKKKQRSEASAQA